MSFADFWDHVAELRFDNEASVETRLVAPLLSSLGYGPDDVAPKYPVVFHKGSRGRKHEADFVCFADSGRTRDSSLLVVEVKRPDEDLEDAKLQAESYSSALRVPVYVLTNGVQFQLWQMQTTRESELLIDVSVLSLTEERGRLESILGKTALLALCQSLKLKTIKPGTLDFSGYLRQIEPRCYSPLRISRRLQYRDQVISSTDALALGSCIYLSGGSGLGKSDLSRELVLHQASALASGVEQRPPVRVDLPDVVVVGKGLLSYVHDRLRAHVSALATEATFRSFLTSTGIVLIVDGYDRVPLAARPSVLAESRALACDYPKLQLVLLGRGTIDPTIEAIQHVTLLPLDAAEQRQVAERARASFALHNLGAPLDRLCENPYFLQLLIADAQATRTAAHEIVPLFRRWLDRLLSGDHPNAEVRLYRDEAMKALAIATSAAPVTLAQAMAVLDQHHIPRATLDDLLRLGAIAGGNAFELEHEIVADFLRAEVLVSEVPAHSLPAAISTLDLSTDSSFPILLAALLPSREAQRALWRRLLRIGAPLYLAAVRYRADSSAASLSDPGAQEHLLEDILDSVDDFLDTYIPTLGPIVRARLSHGNDLMDRIAIRGQCSGERMVTYAYAPVLGEAQRLVVTDPVLEHRLGSTLGFRGRDLHLSGMRRDGGREIGTRDVRAEVKNLVEHFELPGGVEWSREYLWSLLPTVSWRGEVDPLGIPVQDLRVLVVAAGSRIPTLDYEETDTRPLLAAIDTVIAAGDQTVGEHRPQLDTQTRDGMIEFTRQKYDRAIAAYRDLITRHFSGVAAHLRHFPQMPIRFDIAIGAGGGVHQFVEYPRWLPVASWEDATTVVTWTDEPAQGLGDEATARTIRHALEALGRPGETISFGGWDTRLHDEYGATAVARQVTEWLMADVHYLFRPIGVDWPG